MSSFDCSVFTVPANHNPVGKRVFLNEDGTMGKQTLGNFNVLKCSRIRFDDLGALAKFIEEAGSDTHLTAGINENEHCLIVPDGASKALNTTKPVINRNKETFKFHNGPGIMVVDSDNLNMLKVSAAEAINKSVPALSLYNRIEMSSSGANIYGSDDFVEHRGLTGQHTVFLVQDATDIPRALEVLHKRCYIAGFGMPRLSADGKFLERSPVDLQLRVAVQPIYLKVMCEAGLSQAKSVKVISGLPVLDTRRVLPDLTEAEDAQYKSAVASARSSMLGESKKVRNTYKKARVDELVSRGVDEVKAEDIVEEAMKPSRRLSHEWPIIASDGEETTVGDILLEGAEEWHGRTVRDPIEPDYGSNTVAKVFFNEDNVVINSMAHGGRVFILTHNHEDAADTFAEDIAAAGAGVAAGGAGATGVEAFLPGANQDNHSIAFGMIYGGRLLYGHDVGKWFGYREKEGRWFMDELGKVSNLVRVLCRSGSSKAKKLSHYSAVESICKADPVFAVKASATFDRDNYLLNTPGGVVDLRSGNLLPSSKELMLSKCARATPELGCHTPVFDKFLDEITDGDKELARFLQVSLGACLSGAVESHWLLFWIGTGRNGKNTLGDLVMWLMGDYAKKIPATTLMAKEHEGHPTEIASLMGCRLAVSSEIEQGAFWQEAKINELTGDGTISARFMRQDFFEFARTHKHLVFGNNRPRLKTVTEALKARIKIVPFKVSFVGREDPDLPAKLQAEAGGVLRWLIDGHLEWLRLGKRLPKCAAVEAESADYFDNQSVVEMWVKDCLTVVQDDGRAVEGWPTAKTLYNNYSRWKEDRGEKPLSMTIWGESMSKLFFKRRSRFGIHYVGVALENEFSPFV